MRGKKIIPIFSQRERERERVNIVPEKYTSGSYPELLLFKT
jgi:hypothetical protein